MFFSELRIGRVFRFRPPITVFLPAEAVMTKRLLCAAKQSGGEWLHTADVRIEVRIQSGKRTVVRAPRPRGWRGWPARDLER